MNTWDYVVIEAYCFAESDEPPCGKEGVSGFCLLGCPYFGHVSATPREAAVDVPLRLVLWDKLREWWESTSWDLRWHLWERWRYGDDWLDDIPSGQLFPETLVPAFWQPDVEDKFKLWLHKVTAERKEEYNG